MRRMAVILATLLGLVAPLGVAAQDPSPLQVIVFSGGFNWPL